MAEYIDRDLTEKALMERCSETGYGGLTRADVKIVMRTPWRIPSADVIERKQGMWIDANLNFLYKCSECGRLHDELTNYCPYCGTEMRGQNRRPPE